MIETMQAYNGGSDANLLGRVLPLQLDVGRVSLSPSLCPPLFLSAVNVMLRKIAVAAASKPAVEIRQDGESFYIKTSTTVRTTEISFTVGQDFTEQTVDGRPCLSSPCWDTDSRIRCVQTLLKGEGPHTSWTREITNDGELILTMRADDVICTRVYTRE
ncbi:cellular retinoic acid-binding protein 2a [Polyodon spathula]|uniref:cellular retinoic acid-binding protein 2a n=1 Tax=Polyodon spathula TaxID=7913 RepID=UPI001B7EF101|nr:cellular retinoic acid-binding protein 2a [Polyodon spathula]